MQQFFCFLNQCQVSRGDEGDSRHTATGPTAESLSLLAPAVNRGFLPATDGVITWGLQSHISHSERGREANKPSCVFYRSCIGASAVVELVSQW